MGQTAKSINRINSQHGDDGCDGNRRRWRDWATRQSFIELELADSRHASGPSRSAHFATPSAILSTARRTPHPGEHVGHGPGSLAKPLPARHHTSLSSCRLLWAVHVRKSQTLRCALKAPSEPPAHAARGTAGCRTASFDVAPVGDEAGDLDRVGPAVRGEISHAHTAKCERGGVAASFVGEPRVQEARGSHRAWRLGGLSLRGAAGVSASSGAACATRGA